MSTNISRFLLGFSLRWLISSALLYALATAFTRPVHWEAGPTALLLCMTALGNIAPAMFNARRNA